MRRHLLIVLVMLCGGTVSSSAIDWGGMKSALDTMVNARIVRWSQTIAADTMAMQFYSYPNSYGSTFKPSYGTGGSGSKGGTFDLTKILGGGEPSANDTLSITRIDDKRVQMRIGSKEASAFEKPVSIVRYGDTLFICNEGSRKVRTVSLLDYAVADYLKFEEPVRQFFAVDKKEFVRLDSGVYQL